MVEERSEAFRVGFDQSVKPECCVLCVTSDFGLLPHVTLSRLLSHFVYSTAHCL